MGILNITPDSFSDGGRSDAETIAALDQLLTDGADIIDVGAESTRPGATPLTHAEEWARLEGLLPNIIQRTHAAGKRISLDTRHAQTAKAALALGVDILNDVSGCTAPEMIAALAESDCDVVCMHSLTIPADPTVTVAAGLDVVMEMRQFAKQRITALTAAGIAPSRIIFDPGIGFNKTAAQSLELIRRADELKSLGLRLLIGHSRKSFLGSIQATPSGWHERDMLTLAVSQYLVQHGVDILRVHHIQWHAELLHLMKQLYASE